ncbi:MAG: hypothetical protein ACE5KF_08610 [Kiloniellaceae bacterium]
MAAALEAVEAFGRGTGLVVVPAMPSRAMRAEGAEAGGVAEETARRIYRARIAAAE